MTSDDYVRSKLLSFAWRCGISVSKNAVIAIMFIVRTRVEAREDKNWLVVINELEGEVGLTDPDPTDIRDPQFISLLEYVDAIYDGTKQDRWTSGATHWHSTQGAWPRFHLSSKQRVGNLEGLVFYK